MQIFHYLRQLLQRGNKIDTPLVSADEPGTVQNGCRLHPHSRFPSAVLQTLPIKTGYATKGALITSAHLSVDAVSALRKSWVVVGLEVT